MSGISVIGLGAVGGAIARTLQRAGHEVTVWNRSAEKMQQLVAKGSTGVVTILEAVLASPVILGCLDSYATTRSLLGTDEVVAHLSGRAIVQLSTGTPREVQDFANWCAHRNVDYVDGAMECIPAAVGTTRAQFLFAGPEPAYRRVEPFLKCLGGDLRYLGENIRAPAALDLAWLSQRLGQMIGALHGVCLCESENVGIDAFEQLFPDGDRVRVLARRVRCEDYLQPDATVAVWAAVSRRFGEQARDAGIGSEFPNFAASVISRAIDAGHTNEDVAALVKVLRTR